MDSMILNVKFGVNKCALMILIFFNSNSYLDNFSEKLNRNLAVTNPYTKNMEEAIQQYRGSAEKTFELTKPGELFRDPNDENTGNFLKRNDEYNNFFLLEINNLRLTAPMQFDIKSLGNFRKERKLTWTEVKINLNKFNDKVK